MVYVSGQNLAPERLHLLAESIQAMEQKEKTEQGNGVQGKQAEAFEVNYINMVLC